MIIDGRRMAEDVLIEAAEEAARLSRTPSFAAFVVEPSAATLSYLRMKEAQARRVGIDMRFHELPGTASTEEVIREIEEATEDAIIVQLPLPGHIDMMRVISAIPEHKDADVLSPRVRESGRVLHPIAASVKRILEQANVTVRGTRVAVIGEGWLVGKPVSAWLMKAGADVTVVTREAGNLEDVVPSADIVVSGAGSPNLLTPELIQEGAVVIDVGTSELGGSIKGDVDPKVSEKAGVYTPVPGGVGPVAVAYLMKNVVELAARNA